MQLPPVSVGGIGGSAGTPDSSRHGLPEAAFVALARGFGDQAAVEHLIQAQGSIQRELLSAVGQFGPHDNPRFTAAWDLLLAVEETAPTAVTEVLRHPYVRVWAQDLLRQARLEAFNTVDTHHLEAIAASAALHARIDSRAPVPVRDGVAPLPTFGALAAEDAEPVWIRTGSPDELELLQPLRGLVATNMIVTLEDTDPYRYCHTDPAPRLGATEVRHWAQVFAEAIDFIDEHMPAFAPALHAGLRTVMPMRPVGSDGGTARAAFGAVGIALRADQTSIALTLVHEFQHMKLGAVLDMVDLYDRADIEPRFYAPWRSDPRPIEGLLQGTYAHLAVTEYWRVQRTLATEDNHRDEAERQFARWRGSTAAAITELRKSGALTPLGHRFVTAMNDTVEPWLNEPVTARAQTEARQLIERHHTGFQERMAAGARSE